MEQGDLAAWDQPRLVLVLEGLLATITDEKTGKRFRRKITRSIHWHDIPLKRIVYLKRLWPDTSIEVVTFLDQEAADTAAKFFDEAHIPVSSVSYHPFKQWLQEITWQPDIKTIYDSVEDRLNQYGQRGRGVLLGGDFY